MNLSPFTIMKRIYLYILALISLAVASCEMIDQETKYYVKYEVEAVDGTDVSEYHQILVITALEKNQVTEFFVKDYWCQEFGPYYSGDYTYIKVDSPNLDTYLVRVYLKEGKNGEWQLFRETWNQVAIYIP